MSTEYPKAITVDGLPITATDAEDEARWTAGKTLVADSTTDYETPKVDAAPAPVAEPEVPESEPAADEPVDPLADIETDGAATNDGHAPEQTDDEKPSGKSRKKK